MSDDAKAKDEPKIIVDDDWKSQVEREKEELRQQQASAGDQSAGEDATPEKAEMPPATFLVLISTLATQAMASMGLLPDPISGKPSANLPMAKHFIDLLAMLKEKTKGNLTEEESDHLRDGLHQLRMGYVSLDKPKKADGEGTKSSTIELP